MKEIEVTLRFKTTDTELAESLRIAWIESEGISVMHAQGVDSVDLTYVKTREVGE